MPETMTRVTDKLLRQVLRRRSAPRRKTISEVVRETLDEALLERQADLRAARLLTALLRPAGKARRRREPTVW